MWYEVENKFPVADLAEVARRLSALGAPPGEPVVQVDTYYRHPARDFARTDEALRIRRVGSENAMTYKGPKIDHATKTRQELELPLPPGDDAAAGFAALLEALGFSPVAAVRKTRRQACVTWQNQTVSASLDDVDGVGTFCELEICADLRHVDAARSCLASLADGLGLSGAERRSYLELLLQT